MSVALSACKEITRPTLHLIFGPSLNSAQSQNPQRSPAAPAVLLNLRIQIWSKSKRDIGQVISLQALTLRQTTAFVIALCLLLTFKTSVNAADFYKYLDQNGTVVFTDDLLSVPPEMRDHLEKITMPGSTPDSTPDRLDESTILEDFTDGAQLKTLGEKQLRKGRVALRSFLQDQKVLLVAYVITGIILFMFLSKLLGNLGGHLLRKIIFKIVFVIALFCGAYFWYLSYLDKNVLNFDLGSKGGRGAPSQLTTPTEMLKKTLDMIDQINTKTEEKQELLDGLE